MIKNIKAFTAQTTFNKSIEGVGIYPDKVVATDSFKLIEVKMNTGAEKPYVLRPHKAVKTFDSVEGAIMYQKGVPFQGEIMKDDFPKYEEIIPKGTPVISVNLSPELLKEVCTEFIQKGYYGFTMSIYGDMKPIVFTRKQGDKRAILSPMSK